MNKENFIEETLKLGIKLSDKQLDQLEEYYNLLVNWNKKINLTAITKKEEVYLKHFYDCLTIVKVCDLSQELHICDVGTGAGFPGIVLKIAFPHLKITLLDSLTKRIVFLQEIINKLELKDIETVDDRAENYSKNNIEKYDIVVSRAVAKLNILLEMISPMIKLGGSFIAMKGEVEEELKNSLNAINILGFKLEKKEEFYLYNGEQKRNLIVAKKTEKTDKKYPRNFDKIKKNPL